MFEIDGFELEFTEDALELIAEKAIERETGARGLRAILEETLSPLMFELPSLEKQGKVLVDQSVVNGEQPKVIPFPEKKQSAS
jgi:ATP-dependent Clp protease ATP-binding subunit ClpX